MAKKWEYLVGQPHYDQDQLERKKGNVGGSFQVKDKYTKFDLIQMWLNKQGEDGWKLVQYLPQSQGEMAILRREKA
ncbi:MAG: hypothetical protein HN929_10685 [Chloroflexi bacterium]|jgi:hypothetical protein|nr:hypothetical protein [Chloroflexota bacterium]MBT7081910.1 hypothetical protein [Chloroflexota bacterium]MBT7289819.1 hypothetical protein [Chloroflexota bacterium]